MVRMVTNMEFLEPTVVQVPLVSTRAVFMFLPFYLSHLSLSLIQ